MRDEQIGTFGRQGVVSLFLLGLVVSCTDTPTRMLTAPGQPSLDRGGSHVRYVSPSGSNTGDCAAAPCETIGYAIAQASAGDVVSVAAGTYHETVSVTKRLDLVGTGATIDAAGMSSPPNGVVIAGAGAAGSSLSGFTIVNAGLEGIFVNQTSNVTIRNNVVANNDAYGPFAPQCVDQPDDCGEAIHLQSVTRSTVRGNDVHDNIGGILLTDEDGPTYGIMIADNVVTNNTLDCGITLASHAFHIGAPVTPDVGGVYQNTVLHNTSNGNGAAGIGVFAGPPGATAWGNMVTGNTARNNGFSGVMIHSHTPFQYVNDNVVTNNTLSGNGIDDDNTADDAPAGISIFADLAHGAKPIQRTVVAGNSISGEHYGIITLGAVTLSGIQGNKYSGVAVPVSIH
jgi:parallel beta-helix repeat protein